MMSLVGMVEIISLYNDYCRVIDSRDWELWPEFFTDHGTYRLKPRENEEQGLPLCLLALESKAMMKDRVYGVKETLYHDPYYQRHLVAIPTVLAVEDDGALIRTQANYVVIRTKLDGDSKIFSAGYYQDEVVRTESGWKFQSRLCVYDTEMIANSVIYPI